MPKSSSIGRNATLFDSSIGKFRDGVDFKAGGVSVGPNDVEASLIGIKVFPNWKGDESSIVCGEEIFFARL